ncbi:MAG: HDOD domain-containing protein [Spirochaetales bacterium]|nr:HDOD domain-containing protein [Spirochaetales bacterium]
METKSQTQVDVGKIKKATRMGIPLSITTYTLPHEIELYIAEVLACFLAELNQQKLKDYLVYCINELTTNAKKANTKRIYFAEKKLDINDSIDYEEGMRTFKEDTLSNIDHYLLLQKEAGLYVKVLMQVKGRNIILEIRNNSEMTKTEFKRVFDKIARSRQFASLEDAFSQVMDDSEGAGLGLVIMILMLKKVGLDDENYEVMVEGGETITRISMPMDMETQEHMTRLTDDIVSFIDTLPQFPENIARIEKLLNDPESKLSTIASHISNDVVLTTDLLKLVNSAAFSLQKKCTSIIEAVKLVGIRGIKNLLYSIGTMHLLGSATDEQKRLWDHSYKAGFYTYNLARNFLKNRVVTEDAYVCGLLHDLGKIVFSAVYPDLLDKIQALKVQRNIPDKVYDALLAGINHPEIGAALAEKWNFPPALVAAIRFHHAVSDAPEEYRNIAATVCLADLMIHYQEKSIEFYQIDPALLKQFAITSEAHLQKICESFQRGFMSEQSR